MINIDIVKINLPFKKKFAISKGEATSKTNFLTILNNRYIGEASGSIYYGPTVDEIESDLKTGAKSIMKMEKIDLQSIEQISRLEICAIARSALSQSMWLRT